jgi:ParB-like chromosome segregation protein Spo0J
MRSLEDCYEEVETELLNGHTKNLDLMNLAIQLQRNDVLSDIEERLEILTLKISDTNEKLDNIAFNLSEISKDIV